ncbi:hypothetical protein PoB_005240800 [Plakobranchus ocellatus]|uniref:Uncharacterized protein n=1 Tax=Plakobranchus ocellatus TaxID=259542 RepID=A0AAV4C4I2_9GAST|nr:hypothetical protein PoB_005240800 [Plakobranchus ocellatus]
MHDLSRMHQCPICICRFHLSKRVNNQFHQLVCSFCIRFPLNSSSARGVGCTVASESALRSARTFLSRVRAPPPAPWPTEGLKA